MDGIDEIFIHVSILVPESIIYSNSTENNRFEIM